MKIREYFHHDGISKIIMLSVAAVFSILLISFIVFNIKYLLPISLSYALLISSCALLALAVLFWFGYHFIWLTGNTNSTKSFPTQ